MGVNIIPIPCDKDGIITDELRAILRKRNRSSPCKLLYCCPTSIEPTGVTLSRDRRYELYTIARDFNLIIIEHDPFYFLQTFKVEYCFLSFWQETFFIFSWNFILLN